VESSSKLDLSTSAHPRRTRSDLHDLSIGAFSDSIECRTILGVTIPNQQLWSRAEWRDLAQLLGSPLLGRCTRHANVHDSFGVHVDDEERKDRSKPDVVELKEIGLVT
jgi:hypothetical protein